MQAIMTNPNEPLAKTYESKTCQFCNSAEDNELLFGALHFLDEIVVHYYCLLLSSNVAQNGRDDEGILGFLVDDIRKELTRGKRLHCSYCRKAGATLGCCNLKCKTMFHLPCGIANGSLHQFYDQFMSFCKNHRPRQKVPPQITAEARKRGACCGCCIEPIEPQPSINILWAPCCKKSSFFHRRCVQQLALSAGYFFRCPLCNNTKLFAKTMTEQGIYVPDRDASWELVPGAYRELYVRPNECVAFHCKCPKGRNFSAGDNSNSKWMVKPCDSCGSKGVHIGCGMLNLRNPKWDCEECMTILNKPREEGQNSVANAESNEEGEDDEENIDVDETTSDSAEPDLEEEESNDSGKEKKEEINGSGVAEPDVQLEYTLEGRRLSRRLRRRSAQKLELPPPRRSFIRSSSATSTNSAIGFAVPSGSRDSAESHADTPQESPASSSAELSEQEQSSDADADATEVSSSPPMEIVELSSDDEDEATTPMHQGNESSKLTDFLVTLDGSKLEVHKMHTPLVPGEEQLSVVGDVKIPQQGLPFASLPSGSNQPSSSEIPSGSTFKNLKKVFDEETERQGFLTHGESKVTVIPAPNNTMYSVPMSTILPNRSANNTNNQTQEFCPQIASVCSLGSMKPGTDQMSQFLNLSSSSQVVKAGSKFIRIDNLGNLTSPVQPPTSSNIMNQNSGQMKNQHVNVAARLNNLPLNIKPVIDSVNVSMSPQSQPLTFARINPNSGNMRPGANAMRQLNPFSQNFTQLSLQNPNVQQLSLRQSNPILSSQLQSGINMNNLISNTIERQLTSGSNNLPNYTQLINRSGGITLIQNGIITQEPGLPFRIENAVGNSTAYSTAQAGQSAGLTLTSNLPTMQPPFQMRRQMVQNPGESCTIDLTSDEQECPPSKRICPEIVILD